MRTHRTSCTDLERLLCQALPTQNGHPCPIYIRDAAVIPLNQNHYDRSGNKILQKLGVGEKCRNFVYLSDFKWVFVLVIQEVNLCVIDFAFRKVSLQWFCYKVIDSLESQQLA